MEGELVTEIYHLVPFSHVSAPEHSSDCPLEDSNVTPRLPRVPAQSGANWFGKKLWEPKRVKSVL